MKKIYLSLIPLLVLFILPSVIAQTVHYDSTNIVAGIYLDRPAAPENFYSYMTWDLGNDLNNGSIDFNNIESILSLAVVGGTSEINASICLISNQNINLLNDTVSQIDTFVHPSCVQYTFTGVFNGARYDIDISNLLRDLLVIDQSAQFLTLRMEDLSQNALTPNHKNVNSELKIGGDTTSLSFALNNHPAPNRPYLNVSYQAVDPMNITVLPNEFRWLPQVESNKQLDLNGLERTYLKCFWQIDGVGEDFVDMTSNLCPGTQQNFTFANSEDYVVQIAYLEIAYNDVTHSWDQTGNGTSGELQHKYNLVLPEPPQSWLDNQWNSILNALRDLISGWVCQLFPSLGFCS